MRAIACPKKVRANLKVFRPPRSRWLNWLTILLGCSAIDASSLATLLPIPRQPALIEAPRWFAALVIVFAALTLMLSYWPVRNMISRRQRMNMSFNPFHLVNTYGAFGSIGRTRREVVIEGTDEPRVAIRPQVRSNRDFQFACWMHWRNFVHGLSH